MNSVQASKILTIACPSQEVSFINSANSLIAFLIWETVAGLVAYLLIGRQLHFHLPIAMIEATFPTLA